jgi:protein-disulfide isomerase
LKIYTVCTLIVFPIAFAAGLAAQSDQKPNPSTVIAEVNGSTVTLGELEQKRGDSLFHPRHQFYKDERKVLDDLIDERLLELQAKRENVTVDELLKRHVTSQIHDPTDQELQVVYELSQLDQPFAAVRGTMFTKIRELRINKARAAYIKTLRAEAKVSVTLPEPRAEFALDEHTPVRGPRNAPVMVVEFADYQCPYCRQLEPQLEQLKNELGDKMAIAYKDYPLQMHNFAPKMAEAARCAGEQGKYWEFHDFLFKDLKSFEIAPMKEEARALNLDTAKFDKCVDADAETQLISQDSAQAQNLGVSATPTVFVNGRMLTGVKPDALRQVVQEELAAASSHPRETAQR